MGKLLRFRTIVLLPVIIFSGCKSSLNSDRSKASYSIGQQLGENFRQQDLNLDLDAVSQGIKDGYNKKSTLSKDDMQASLTKMQQTSAKKQMEDAEAGQKAAAEFLSKNKSEKGVKVTKSGLQYIVEKEGTGATPTAKDLVKCNYKGSLLSGTVFDSSYDRGTPAVFPVRGVIAGWTEALQFMKVGEKIKLFIPPELGYGIMVRPQIPPNSVLVFEMELLGIEKNVEKSDKTSDKAKH